LAGWVKRKAQDGIGIWSTFLGVLLTIPFIGGITALRCRRLQLPIVVIGISIGSSLTATWLIPHYLAPILPLILLFVMEGFRRLYASRSADRLRSRFVMSLIGLYFCIAFYQVIAFVNLSIRKPPIANFAQEWAWEREKIRQELLQTAENHLVIVHYAPNHAASPAEWVYNDADIDASRIVWAREMDPASNRKLLDYYQGRRMWFLLADAKPPKLIEINPSTGRPISEPSNNPDSKLTAQTVQ
jgi:hypothetical protein